MMNTLRYLPVMPLLLAGCATTWHAGAPKGAIDVIAHRGASNYAPENTLAAFARAAEMEADWFELDCRLAKDGAIIVIHDEDLERTTGAAGRVREKTLPELKELDAGKWFAPEFVGEKLPTLGESLDLAKDRIGVYVEIKDCGDDGVLMGRMIRAIQGHTAMTPRLRDELIGLIQDSGTRNLPLTRKVIAEIRERDMKHQVVIQSFSPVACFIALVEAPEMRTEFLGSDPEDKPQQWGNFVAFGHLINVAGFNVSKDALTQERLAMFQGNGKTVAVYTVDEAPKMRQLARWDVDGVITNKPDVCLDVLKEEGKR